MSSSCMMRFCPVLIVVMLFSALFADGPAEINKRLGRGINLGNALEAPTEGSWGVVLNESYFPMIASKGFNSVRIPVRWSTTARTSSMLPYTINETFMARVEWAVQQSLKSGLHAVVNAHHYDSLFSHPDLEHDRFLAIWKQISARFKNYPDSLVFEILNEPNGNLTVAKWNALLAEAIAVIRQDNPGRTIVIGTAEWGGIGGLNGLVTPPGEKNAILTVHYYLPFSFTHQGAEWVQGSTPWLGTTWDASPCEKIAVVQDMETVAFYAKKLGMPVYVGEFGAYSKADMASRERWTAYCARLFERFGFSWSYWEFCSGFGIYDAQKNTWNSGLVSALTSNDTTILAVAGGFNGTNILRNGDFSSGTQSWGFGVWSTTGAATGAVSNGSYHVNVTTVAPNAWNIQLVQGNFSLQKGNKYALLFDVWTDESERPVSVSVQNSTDYANYGGTDCIAGTSKVTVTSCFTMASDRTDGQIAFSFGSSLGAVNIDNVQLLKLEPLKAEPNPVHMAPSKRRAPKIKLQQSIGKSHRRRAGGSQKSLNGRTAGTSGESGVLVGEE